MTDEEKKAIEHLTKKMKYHQENILDTFVWLTLDEHYVRILLNLIKKQQAEIENKDKIIDKMAENIVRSDSDLCEYIDLTYKNNKCQVGSDCKQCIIEYFTNKVKGEENVTK